MALKETFELYDLVWYSFLKWSITVPVTFLATLVDLALFGVPKKLIDTSYCMSSFPFFRNATREKEKAWASDDISCIKSMTNQGFGGLARCLTSIAIELPISFAAVVIAAICTFLHVIIANTIGKPLAAVMECVANNMCGQ